MYALMWPNTCLFVVSKMKTEEIVGRNKVALYELVRLIGTI